MRRVLAAFVASAVLLTGGGGSVASAAVTHHSHSRWLAHHAQRISALRHALSRLGDPYVFGGEGPRVFDCSGLVQWAYRQAGRVLPRTSQEQWLIGWRVARGHYRRGDLVFEYPQPGGPGHVGIYLGHDRMIDAPHTGAVVRIERIYWREFVGMRRIR
jgi:cell wall-associated NlpC family hydrolase